MIPANRLVFIACMLSVCAVAFANKISVPTAATPGWVKQYTFQYNQPDLQKKADFGYLDIALIQQVNIGNETVYERRVRKVINEDGIDNLPGISAAYNPAYQTLQFHEVMILRNGKKINKLAGATFNTYAIDDDIKLKKYDASKTLYLEMDDVEVGDVIEYAYSIKGFNPLFNQKYSQKFQIGFSEPLAYLYYRIITPTARKLYVEYTQVELNGEEINIGNETVYEWSRSYIVAVEIDDLLPTWYDPYPAIMISEYNDWQNIRDWATQLFPANITIDAPLHSKLLQWQQQFSTREQRTAAALRFVQDSIEYVSADFLMTYKAATNPNKVFAQRYADSKEKAYLLQTMLGAMGIPSSPVLVNTVAKQSIASKTPSPKIFDRVVLQVTIGTSQYYVDPSLDNQRGPLAAVSFPDYQSGLVLGNNPAGISRLEALEPGKVITKEVFTIPGMATPVTLTVKTINTGSFADEQRSSFKNTSAFQVQKNYKQFYATYFPKIEADTIYYEDDEATGAFTVYEQYTINDFWTMKNGIKSCNIYAFTINGYLTGSKQRVRTMPLSIYFPGNFIEEIEVNLPEEWSLSDFDRSAKSAAFTYTAQSRLAGRKLSMVFTLNTVRDHVMPEEMSGLENAYNTINNDGGWQLTYDNRSGNTSHQSTNSTTTKPVVNGQKILVRLAVLFAVLVAVFVFAVYKSRPKRKQSAMEDYV